VCNLSGRSARIWGLCDYCQPDMRFEVDRLLGSLIPRSCVFCGLEGGERACCDGCFADLPWIAHPPDDQSRCADRQSESAGRLRVLSALAYEYPVDRIIAGAKFRQRLDFAAALGELLATYLCSPACLCLAEASTDRPDIVVPVPLHRRRLAMRGFNQAAEIAAPVAARLGLPLRSEACVRVRHTPEQTSLTGRARRHNLAGAFVAQQDLAGLRVAIVDDVYTTGATGRAVAAALMERGAGATQIWTVARTT